MRAQVYRRGWLDSQRRSVQCREKLPHFGRDSVHIRDRHHVVYEWGEFPLVDDKADVVMTFAAGELFRRPEDPR